MALIPSTTYPAQTDAAPGYPQGKARNAATFQDGTGTPLERQWVNDTWGFQQALLAAANITPTGNPDEVGASQYLEAVAAVATQQAIAQVSPLRLRLRLIGTNNPYADTSNGLAVISRAAPDSAILAIKAGASDVHRVYDDDRTEPDGSMASLTGAVRGVARNGSRLVAIGTGGNLCAFSTNEGETWTAGSSLGAGGSVIVYNAPHARFMVTFLGGSNVAHDVDGASVWTNVVTGLASAQGGIALFSNGDAVAGGLDGSGDVDFAVSSDGGGSWSIAGGTVPNAGDYDAAGSVVGNAGATIYHAGLCLSGTEIRICSSTDGLAWTLLETITGLTAAFDARLMMCPDTGLLVVVYRSTQAFGIEGGAVASIDGGVTWSEPTPLFARLSQNYGVAKGRLFATSSSSLFATDRLAF